MKKVVLSPHIDDAILSLGGSILDWLSNGDGVEIVSIFSRSASPFFWRRSAICNSEKETKTRKAEEQTVANSIGEIFAYLDLPSSTCRGLKYLRPWIPLAIQSRWPRDRQTFKKLLQIAVGLLQSSQEIYAPIAPEPGAHIDHIMLRDACRTILRRVRVSSAFFLYEDQPYSSRIRNLEEILNRSGLMFRVNPISVGRKAELSLMYKSQVRKKWMAEIISYHRRIGGERVWQLRPGEQMPFRVRFDGYVQDVPPAQ